MRVKLWKDYRLKKKEHYGIVKDDSGQVYEPHFGMQQIGMTNEKLEE